MNCSQVQNELPALVYGELEHEQVKAIEEHLSGCSECRKELAALRHTRQLLDAARAPVVPVEAGAILQAEADRQVRRLKRWRRLAVLAAAAAAVVVALAIGLSLEVRVEAHQLVFRWGSPPTDPAPDAGAAVLPLQRPESDAALQAQLVLLTQLAQGLTETLAERDAKQRKELTQLQNRVRDLQRQAGFRLGDIERDVSALYAAVFGASKKGATQ